MPVYGLSRQRLATESGRAGSVAPGPVLVTGVNAAAAGQLAGVLRSGGLDCTLASDSRGPRAGEAVVFAVGADTNMQPADAYWAAFEAAKSARMAGASAFAIVDSGTQGALGGFAGLARTAAAEWLDCRVRYLRWTVQPGAGMAEALHAVLDQSELAVESDGRQITTVAFEPLARPRPAVGAGPRVWIVSGGARGVTSDCIVEVARRSGGQFILLGRSQMEAWPDDLPVSDDEAQLRGLLASRASARGERLTPRAIGQMASGLLAGRAIGLTLSRLQAAGAQAEYRSCDLADAASVAEVIATVTRQYGRIEGLVHGAGVLADRLILDKTQADFQRVFSTKVEGLQNLLAALETNDLTHIGLFSSAAAQFGNRGQSDYAVANCALNSMAHDLARRLPGAVVKAFNWGPWDGGMVDATLAQHFRARGISLIPLKAGAEIFADHMLSVAGGPVELLVGETWDQPAA